MQGDPINLAEMKKQMEKLESRHFALIQNRIDHLVGVYGSTRKLGKAIGVDHAYLHRLRKGTKTDPGESVLKKLGLL